jgi:hypothetical protein
MNNSTTHAWHRQFNKIRTVLVLAITQFTYQQRKTTQQAMTGTDSRTSLPVLPPIICRENRHHGYSA